MESKQRARIERTGQGGRRLRQEIAVSAILADDKNRKISEEDEDFHLLVESVRVLGVLQPLHVLPIEGDRFRLLDGERRWRAAKRAGLETIACEVWSSEDAHKDAAVAGLVLNEHRKAHGCIAIARRLRQIKNELDLTLEALAARTGLPIDRIKAYSSLFGGSDALIEFFEQHDVPLKAALELVRYEKQTNEARARKLIERYRESPLSWHQIAALRKRATGRKEDDGTSDERAPCPRPMFAERVKRAFERDAKRARAELEEVLGTLGLRVVGTGATPSEPSAPGAL